MKLERDAATHRQSEAKMRRSWLGIATGFGLLMAAAAPAGANVGSKTFVADCAEAADPIQRAECRGYIAAVADAIMADIGKGRRLCVPPGTTQDEVREAVLIWMRENARLLRRVQGYGLVYAALIKTYPCRR